MTGPDFSVFRARVIEKIQADLVREQAAADALRAEMGPRIAASVRTARQAGLCGRAWLFGSFSWGNPTANSDVDLLVEGCTSPDGLAGRLWMELERPVHVVQLESAPQSLVERALGEGTPL